MLAVYGVCVAGIVGVWLSRDNRFDLGQVVSLHGVLFLFYKFLSVLGIKTPR